MWERLSAPPDAGGTGPPPPRRSAHEHLVVTLRSTWWGLRSMLGGGLLAGLRTGARAAAIGLNVGGHLQLTRVLTQPRLIGLLRRHPRLNFRYLATYLSHDFSRNTRLTIQINHYSFLAPRVCEDFFTRIYDSEFSIWAGSRAGCEYSIVLSFPVVGDHEGDLALVFRADGMPIYRMSFSIAPGCFVDSAAEQALFVGCIQGRGGYFPSIRDATRNCHDITPAALLLAAVQGIAQALGIEVIVGVGRDHAVSLGHVSRPENFFNLDDFWKSFGAEPSPNEFFLLRVPFPEKAIQLIERSHRRRTLRKREYKRQVSQCARESFRANCLDGASPPS